MKLEYIRILFYRFKPEGHKSDKLSRHRDLIANKQKHTILIHNRLFTWKRMKYRNGYPPAQLFLQGLNCFIPRHPLYLLLKPWFHCFHEKIYRTFLPCRLCEQSRVSQFCRNIFESRRPPQSSDKRKISDSSWTRSGGINMASRYHYV